MLNLKETKLRRIIRKELNELHGTQNDIQNISYELKEGLLQIFKSSKEIVLENKNYYSIQEIDLTSIEKENTNISTIQLQINYEPSINNETKISGSFKSDKTKIVNENYFIVFVEININYSKDFFENVIIKENELELILVHELNHAFVYVKKFNKNYKSIVLNKINYFMKFEIENSKELSEFLKMLYLNLPEEIQARVQEAGTILKNIKNKDYNQTIKELYLYQPINDAKNMMKYNFNYQNINKEILENFINKFNSYLDSFKGEMKFKKINNIEDFFDYWILKINKSGDILNRKILKLVADKFNINEEKYLIEIDFDLLQEIFQH